MSKIKVDQLETLDGTVTVRVAGLASAGSGVADHGALAGLADDDHPQYLNVSRGDARYSRLGHGHAVADVAGLQAALDGKAASSHTHAISNVTGLQAALDGKAASSHTHAISNVTGLQAALDGKAVGTGILPDGVNLNSVVASGFYRFNAAPQNAPSGVAWGQLIVSRGGSDTILQIVTGHANGEIYWRQGNPPDVGGPGSWGPWHRFIHSGNIHAAIAGAEVGAVGTYAFLKHRTRDTLLHPGAIVAGSSLRYTGAAAADSASGGVLENSLTGDISPVGTWRCMGSNAASGFPVNIWLRIS